MGSFDERAKGRDRTIDNAILRNTQKALPPSAIPSHDKRGPSLYKIRFPVYNMKALKDKMKFSMPAAGRDTPPAGAGQGGKSVQ